MTYGALSRLSRLLHSGLVYHDFTWNPAGQVLTRTISSNAHVWDHHVNVSRAYAVNNLNQYTAAARRASPTTTAAISPPTARTATATIRRTG